MTNHDNVDHPSHYTEGRAFEVIEVLEDWCGRAPDPVLGGLQWNSLKYQGRVWDKVNPLEDLKKSRWYLNRLIDKLEAKEVVQPRVTYEDVLEAATAEAATGQELLREYGIADVDDQPLDEWGWEWDEDEDRKRVIDRSIANAQKGYVLWDEDDDFMWDPSLGPVEISEEEVKQILSKKNLEQFNEDEIVSTVERRGLIIGFKRDGSSCLLGGSGKCQ